MKNLTTRTEEAAAISRAQILQNLIADVKANKKVKESVQQICQIVKKHGIGEDNNIRLEIYKIMLCISDEEINEQFLPLQNNVAEQEDVTRIQRDCQASFRLFDIFMDSEPDLMQQKRSELAQIVTRLFHENSEFHYYRGFETFGSLFLWHFGQNKAHVLISKISKTLMRQALPFQLCISNYHFILISCVFILIWKNQRQHLFWTNGNFNLNTDALQVDIDKSVSQQVNNIFAIITQEDAQVGQIFSITHFLAFCVGWVLSWWAVNLRKSSHLMRIYDYLICAGPEGVVTLGAAFILGTKEIMKEHIQECFDGGEIGVLFGIYQNIWQVDYDLNHIFEIALSLEKKGRLTNQMRKLYSPLQDFPFNSIHVLPIRQNLKRRRQPIHFTLLLVLFLSLLALLFSAFPYFFFE